LRDREGVAAVEKNVIPRELRVFVRNLISIILVGVAISWWALEYTDVFPTVGGLLGLGGIFAWIAFLSNLISETRKQQLQELLERRVLLVRSTATYALLLLVGFALYAAVHGTIVVVAPLDGGKRTVDVRADGKTITTIDVSPGTTVKESLRIRPGSTIVVKTSGLPELRVPVTSLGRTTLQIPQSFVTQSVVLAYLPESVATSAKDSSVRVKIKRPKSKEWTDYGFLDRGRYTGESIWIGCSPDVPVPPRLEWTKASTELLKKWATARSVGADQPPEPGDQIQVCVMNAEGGVLASAETTVVSTKEHAFPQVLPLAVEGGLRCK
jgi:hypothetical protein